MATAAMASRANQPVDRPGPTASRSITHPVATNAETTRTDSFASLMRALKSQEQIQVREWYETIGAPSMDDATPAQIAWMQARHYPMPADIARAKSMSTTDLKAAASTGDTTASILYAARLLKEYNTRISAGMPYSNPTQGRLAREAAGLMPRILASGSPFAGYLFAARYRLMYPRNTATNAATQLAGLVWASKFGDTRANRLLDTPLLQGVDAASAGAAMNLILKKATNANPALFLRPVVPIPSSNQ